MSHIPSSAMPRAKPSEDGGETEPSGRLGRIADAVKEHPRTAVAAGVAVAGAAAAAAVAVARRGGGARSGKAAGKTKAG